MNKNHQINQYYYNGSFFLNDVLWPGAIFLIALTLSSYMFKSFTLHVLLKFVFSIYFFTRLKNIPVKKWDFSSGKAIARQIAWALLLTAITLNVQWIPFIQEWIREGRVYLVITGEQLWYAVILSLASALSEEFVFRGYLQLQLERFFGSPVLAAFILSAIFAIFHLPVWASAVNAFLVSVLYTFALKRFRSVTLITLVLAHFLNNLCSNLLNYT